MKVCFDTNVLIDILGKTEDYFDSLVSLDISILREYGMFISVASTADIAYILPRRSLATKQQTGQLLSRLFEMFEILDVREVDAKRALKSTLEEQMSDYEDALLAQMALRNGIDLIVTRNTRDFENSPVPAMSPAQFAQLYKPGDIEYASMGD